MGFQKPKDNIDPYDYSTGRASIGAVMISIFIVIVSMFLFAWFMMNSNSWPMDKRGQFGDMFAVLNTFFSGLGFLLLVFTLWLQMSEMRSQKNEIIENKRQQQRQNANLERQQFESAFFNMLQLQSEIVKNIDITHIVSQRSLSDVVSGRGEKDTLYGKDCFDLFYKKFLKHYSSSVTSSSTPDFKNLKAINQAYHSFYKGYQNDLGHYFRTLYHLIKFIHGSDVPDKKRYTSIVRAQLSSHELLLLFYNCLSDLGNEKFSPLIETYQILKNLPFSELAHRCHKELYNPSAYEA